MLPSRTKRPKQLVMMLPMLPIKFDIKAVDVERIFAATIQWLESEKTKTSNVQEIIQLLLRW